MFGTPAFRALLKMSLVELEASYENGICRCRLCSDRLRHTEHLRDFAACFQCQPCPTRGCPFCPRHECGRTECDRMAQADLKAKAQAELKANFKRRKAQAELNLKESKANFKALKIATLHDMRRQSLKS
jgi:hypothetical protein